MIDKSFMLQNGVQIPAVAFGTRALDGKKTRELTEYALAAGYRHVQTAQKFGNEKSVGEGVKKSGIPRKEIFITDQLDTNVTGKTAEKAIEASLAALDTEYIDLMLMHTTLAGEDDDPDGDAAVYKALEDAYRAGKLRAIGFCGASREVIDYVTPKTAIPPMVDQMTVYPGQTPLNLIDYLHSKDILCMATSPFGHGRTVHRKEVQDMAARLNVTAAQLCLCYCLQLGILPVARADQKELILENSQIDFEVPRAELIALEHLSEEE